MTNVRTDVRELRIRDRVSGTDRLVPLTALLKRIRTVDPSLFGGAPWLVEQGAYGRGEAVTAIEDALESADNFQTDLEAVFRTLIAGDDEFYNVELRQVAGTISLGIFDSTFLFVRGPRSFVDEVARSFSEVEFVGD
ncbi:MAG: hypothetical protein GEU80_00900 [Dehalococcoidia bacterium]|nr:hypothetical protein [Dehalococcoidia bacterium]